MIISTIIPDMDDYAQAKARLFDKAHFPTLTHAIINLDDEFSALMIEAANASRLTVDIYLTNDQADFLPKPSRPYLRGFDHCAFKSCLRHKVN